MNIREVLEGCNYTNDEKLMFCKNKVIFTCFYDFDTVPNPTIYLTNYDLSGNMTLNIKELTLRKIFFKSLKLI